MYIYMRKRSEECCNNPSEGSLATYVIVKVPNSFS